MGLGTKILVINKVGTLMEVRANTVGDLDLYDINHQEKAKILDSLVKSDRNYKTKAIIINSGG